MYSSTRDGALAARHIIACTRAGAEAATPLGLVVNELRQVARPWTNNRDPEMNLDMQ